MKKLLLVITGLSFILPSFVVAQTSTTYTLHVQGDTIRYAFSADNSSDLLRFSKMDSVNNFNAPQKYEGKISSFVFTTGNQRITIGHNGGFIPTRSPAKPSLIYTHPY